jgi:UDP-N-acetylmuramate dehydrogenase
MQKYTSCFGIPVSVNHFFELKKEKDIFEFQNFLEKNNLKYSDFTIVSGGSNIIFSDEVSHNILFVDTKSVKIINSEKDFSLVKVSAGEDWDGFVNFCVLNNLSGVEALSLIPGKVGSCPVQNIGAYGSEVSDTIFEVEVFDFQKKQIKNFSNDECLFSYRNSIFKSKDCKKRFLIISVTFKLKNSNQNFIPKYKPVQDFFAEKYNLSEQDLKERKVSLQEIREVIISIRSQKLPDPKFLANVGSFFHNPVVDEKTFLKIKEKYSEIPSFISESESGKKYKIPAGFLLEKSGFKGYIYKNSFDQKVFGTYEKNALVLISFGGGSFAELMQFVKVIQDKVFLDYGISLQIEPELIF